MKAKLLTKRNIIAGAACAALITAVVLIVLAARYADGSNAFYIYYYNAALSRLETEKLTLPQGGDNELLAAALAGFSKTPRNPALAKTMPDFENLLISYRINGDMLETWFTPDYYALTPIDEALFRASFVWTMTGLPFIERVRITVGGEALINARGAVIGYDTRESVDISPVVSSERITTRMFTLYYVSEDGLFAEEHSTSTVNMDQLERYIVQRLIDEPAEGRLINAIPPDTKLRDITTADGICYVNLSVDFINKFNGGPALARLTVYAVVNSLIENVSNVRRVQFLFESEKVETFQGSVDLSRPLERDDTLLAGYTE